MPAPPAPESTLTVLMVGSEALPFSKTGGLADVLGSLPQALDALGHRVTLVVPRYRGAAHGTAVGRQVITLGREALETEVYEARLGRHGRVLLLECARFYDREHLYGIGSEDYPDNARRFAFLSRAALEVSVRLHIRPDLVHAHDWQAGLTPVYLRTAYQGHPILGHVRSIFTIHNLAYQGLFPISEGRSVGLGDVLLSSDGLEYWEQVSFLKGGINFSDLVTTVSRRYAREILEPELGFGFHGILRQRAADLVGVPNGIDVDCWSPERDRFLPEPYSVANLQPKAASKRELLARFSLPTDEEALARPLVGMVSRLVDQKGFDLLSRVIPDLLRLPALYVLVGTGDHRYEALWRDVAVRHPDRVGVFLGFDEGLAHLVEGGADLFLMPSRFEPCGLNQLYSLAYGTVPVVHAVGGLDDTVTEFDDRTWTGTGFKFRKYSGGELLGALARALRVYERPKAWRALQRSGMREDHSWNASALEYVKVYRRALRGGRRSTHVGEQANM